MKIKIDMDLPRWLSRLILIGIPIAFVAAAAWVYAQVPNTFTAGQVLTAKQLNDNFTAFQAANAIPPGAIVAYGAETVPAGWLACDGKQYNGAIASYANLYAAIGITNGGDASAVVFRVPDLRGTFLRGWNNGASNDPDANTRTAPSTGAQTGDHVGTLEAAAFASHSHTGTTDSQGSHAHSGSTDTQGSHSHPNGDYFVYNGTGSWSLPGGTGVNHQPMPAGGAHAHNLSISAAGDHSHNVTNEATGGSETRPTNVTVQYIIKL